MKHPLSRRAFLKTSLAASAAISLPARVRAQAPGANGDIRVAVIGLNSRGQDHLANYRKIAGVRIVALCDADRTVLEKNRAKLAGDGIQTSICEDIRKLLESKEVDAVSIATPNHWHSLAGIWACQAGKDVYVEKPVSHSVWEGRQLVKAAAAHQRIVQMGIQSRSGAGLAAALEWLKGKPLGKLKYARGLCYKRRPSLGTVNAETPWNPSIDRELWHGPAELLPIRRANLHYDWHWVWNTGNGDLGNQGVHQMDIARRFLGQAALSPAVWAVGGRVGYKDDGETPNSLIVLHDYQPAPLIFEVRGLPEKSDSREMDKYRGASVGVIVQYENGHILCPDYNNAAAFDDKGQLLRKFGTFNLPKDTVQSASFEAGPTGGPANPMRENHYANFIAAVRSRKAADLNGPIVEGHISSALCHTANISYRLGKKAAPGVIRERLQASADALDSWNRLADHLAANRVDPERDQLALGEFLKFDPQAEQFPENKEANAMLKRSGRAPFTIPESV